AGRHLLQPWEEQLARLGGMIVGHRTDFVEGLAQAAWAAHSNICGQAELLEAEYCPSRRAEDLLEALQSRQEQDIRLGTTSVGPHRDDLLVRIDGKDTRVYASQGQQRTAALSLKIAQLRLMEQEMGEPPLLMLDDVLSELDQERQSQLFEAVEGVQMIISCTDAARLPRQGRVFRVQQGRLLAD
ncbi:MAG: DNA replication/repair protein RecF, partial [Christensenellales bacterium]